MKDDVCWKTLGAGGRWVLEDELELDWQPICVVDKQERTRMFEERARANREAQAARRSSVNDASARAH